MTPGLKIECNWLARDTGDDVNRHFYSELGLAVADGWLTQLEDIPARTVRTHMRGSGYRLAQWLASNWWRLRWEPESPDPRSDHVWRQAHSVAAAGEGYIWPDVTFACDGESVGISTNPSQIPPPYESIRYLSQINTRIPAEEFEREVDLFMEGILSRIHSLNMHDDYLQALWYEIVAERGDPGTARWRKLEALCGCDPDEAPTQLIETLLKEQQTLGFSAIEEVAALGRQTTNTLLDSILGLLANLEIPSGGGFQGTMPTLQTTWIPNSDARPWEQAANFAQHVRQDTGFGNKAITDTKLADLLCTKASVFTDRSTTAVPMPIAFRTDAAGGFNLYFNSKWSTSRRFTSCRLLGDHLYRSDMERMLPATKVKTARQQFQRAFAQEFLCPFDALLEMIQTAQPGDDDIEEAAQHFGVSPQLVHTTLVNKGVLDRETLNWLF